MLESSPRTTIGAPQTPHIPSTLHLRNVKRTSNARSKVSPVPASLETPLVPSTKTLASLCFLVISHLSDLEKHLSKLETPDLEAWTARSGIKIEEVRTWAKTGLEMLDGIQADAQLRLHDVRCTDLTLVESLLITHIPKLPEMSMVVDIRSHIHDIPAIRSHLLNLPQFPDTASGVYARFLGISSLPNTCHVTLHLPYFNNIRQKLDDVGTLFRELCSWKLLGCVPILSKLLQSHLTSKVAGFTKIFGVSSLAPSSLLHHVLEVLALSDLITIINTPGAEVEEKTEEPFEKTTCQVTNAIRRSGKGVRLITYDDLPERWKENPFVTHGYRFIPIERWPLIFKSVFAVHNETLNIHTHLIPLMFFLVNLFSSIRSPTHSDAAETFFMFFACICFLGSTIWHMMAGCAHKASRSFGARVDYVGIGWLICASMGVVVHYGYQCHPKLGHVFEVLCFMMGSLSCVLPSMDWFDRAEYRFYRILFFLSLVFSGVAPVCGMVILHSHQEMTDFIAPLLPSVASYFIGLTFYACRWPERHLPENIRKYLNCFGAGSHAIWHCLIVLGVSLQRQGMQSMKHGFQCV